MAGLLELMSAAGGAIALIDRIAENPKGRNVRKNNPFPGVPTNESDAQAVWEQLRAALQSIAPYVAGYVSTLGGAHRASILFTVSFDPRETWVNGILENSRYGKFHWENDGTLSKISGYGTEKLRKSKAKSVADVVRKIESIAPAQSNPRVRSQGFTQGLRDAYERGGTQAYKNYLITHNALHGVYFVTRGGHNIATAQTITQAKKMIDEIADNPRSRSKRGITRPSQITKRAPTKRLLKRRKATAKAPRGFFANPDAKNVFRAKDWRTVYSIHKPSMPSSSAIAWFSKKSEAVEVAQEYANRTGEKLAVSAVEIWQGSK